MIQFSRPKKTLAAAMDPYRRREASATEYLDKGKLVRLLPLTAGRVPGPAPSRFDPAYYRTHDTISFVPPDAQSVVSQAITNNLPIFGGAPFGQGKNKMSYSGYASSVVSQQPAESETSQQPRHIGFSQYDRLNVNSSDALPAKPRRRLSAGSLAPSDAPTASMYAFGYKAGHHDDAQSIAPSQAGVTDF